MRNPSAVRLVVSGTVASLVSAAALALLARREGKGALQPVNATSHWFHGERAGAVKRADMAHTGLGYATHHASALFWALPFELWRTRRPPRTPLQMLRDASVISAIAAAVDYGLVPKRLTPGWESVLSKRSIAATYGALALGLTAGALIAQGPRRRAPRVRHRRVRAPASRKRSRAGDAAGYGIATQLAAADTPGFEAHAAHHRVFNFIDSEREALRPILTG